MLSNMAASLLLNKRIETTLAKAKELRKYAEPLITRSKEDTTHNRRTVFSYLQSKEAVKELFGAVAEKVAERPGGYTRIVKLGTRQGDNAEMALIELVDFNEVFVVREVEDKKTTRRSRRGGKKAEGPEAAALQPGAEQPVEKATPAIEPAPETEKPAADDAAVGGEKA